MTDYSLLVFVAYMMLIVRIIPKSAFEFDLCHIKFNLLPYWARFFSLGIGIVATILFAFNFKGEKAFEALLAFIHLALFIFLFSKQKEEDEFSENVRLKSFTYSFVSFAAMIGMFLALDLNTTGSKPILNALNLSILFAASLLLALIYFYVTLFKLKKENE